MHDVERLKNYRAYANRLLGATDRKVLAHVASTLAMHIAYCHQKYGAVPLEESLAVYNEPATDEHVRQFVDAMELLAVFMGLVAGEAELLSAKNSASDIPAT